MRHEPALKVFDEDFEFFDLSYFSFFQLFLKEDDHRAGKAISHEDLLTESTFEEYFAKGFLENFVELIHQVFLLTGK